MFANIELFKKVVMAFESWRQRGATMRFLKMGFFALLCCGLLCSRVLALDTVLRVAVNPNLPPFQMRQADGQLIGLHIDLIKRLAQRNNYLVEYVVCETDSACERALANGEADLILGVVPPASLPENGPFTAEISRSSLCMIAPKRSAKALMSGEALNGHRAVFERGTIGYSFMSSLGNLSYHVVSDQMQVFSELYLNDSDVAVAVKSSAVFLLHEAGISDDFTILRSYMVPISYTIEVAPGNKSLREELNSGLESLRVSGEYNRLFDKWTFAEKTKSSVLDYLRQYWYITVGLPLIMFSIVWNNLRMNRKLKLQVAEKTAELQKTNAVLELRLVQIQNDAEVQRRIIETSPNAMLIIDLDGRIRMLNKSACKIMGVTQAMVGEPVDKIALCEFLLLGRFEQALHGMGCPNDVKKYVGNGRSYQYSIFPLYELNSVAGALLEVKDITQDIDDRRQLLEREKNRVLTQLVAGIAHEIKNPLTSIKNFAVLLKRKKDSPQFQESFSSIVPQEVERINQLIESLIDYARPHTAQKREVMLEEVVRPCIFLIRGMRFASSVDMSITIPPGMTLLADPNQLKQIILNLLLNAVESLEQKSRCCPGFEPKLNIHALRDDDGALLLTVADNGMGMSQDVISKATEPFFTTKPTGTGMGLAIVNQFIEENNGKLVIDSVEMQFTSMTIYFWRAL